MATLKIKRGQSAALDALTLQEGELAVTLDTGKLYAGIAGGEKKLINADINAGQPNGVASLDETGKVPEDQLPEEALLQINDSATELTSTWSGSKISGEFDQVEVSLTDLTKRVDDLAYVKIAVSAMSTTNINNEIGSTVTDANVTWTLNKSPKTQKIKFGNEAEEVLDNALRTKSYTEKSITTNTNIILTVTDDRDATASKTVTISFQPKAYWGVSTKESLESADILTLEGSALTTGKARTFTVNADAGEKIVYAIPSSFGTPTFNVGGFDGGFVKSKTLSHTNASGYEQNYDIWMSVNAGLGNTTVVVK